MPLRSLFHTNHSSHGKDALTRGGYNAYLESLSRCDSEKAEEQKGKVISKLLEKKDVRALRYIGLGPLGFVNNSLRRDCWYELLASQLLIDDATEYITPVEKHKDEGFR